MATKELILNEIEKIPEPLLEKVLDFIRFLKTGSPEGIGTAIASESSLRKDWLRPEEDEAWADL
jgi:hypothetical protein